MFSARVDMRLGRTHNAFVRYTREANSTFNSPGLPSSWSHFTSVAQQALMAVTSVWSPTLVNDVRFSLRGGAGRYFDPASSSNSGNLANERHFLTPIGSGRIRVTNANFRSESTLDFSRQPTAFTGSQLVAILPGQLAEIARSLNPDNRDFSVRTIDFTKAGTNLSDPSYAVPSAIHLSAGVQRELARGFVVSADAVWRRFDHTFINGIDYNRWSRIGGPVIPPCPLERPNDVTTACSNGSIFFDTTSGRANYKGLLVRVEKRLARGSQFLASYALGSYAGTTGTGTATVEATGMRVFGFNNDDWLENYGPLPTDLRHVLNVSGFVDLPLRLQLAFNMSAYSRPPLSAYVASMDFNGDGTINDLLPATKVNQFGRELDEDDLTRVVADYNREFAGRRFGAGNLVAPPLTLPSEYSFDDTFFTQDLRVSRIFGIGFHQTRLALFGEVFNLLNTPNLVGYSGNLINTNSFGQPNGRFTQVFGSGGPRAFQFGARLSF